MVQAIRFKYRLYNDLNAFFIFICNDFLYGIHLAL